MEKKGDIFVPPLSVMSSLKRDQMFRKAKLFFLYLKNTSDSRKHRLETHLMLANAKVKQFFNKDIQYVITDQKHHNDGCSAGNYIKDFATSSCTPTLNNAVPLTRSQRLLAKAQEADTTCDVLILAKKWGIRVIDLEVAERHLERRIKNVQTSITQLSKLKVATKLEGMFLKFENKDSLFRPVFRCYKRWPHLDLKSKGMASPFCKPQYAATNLCNVSRRNRSSKMRDYDSVIDAAQSNYLAVSAPKSRVKSSQYCELCHCRFYDSIEQHSLSQSHQEFASNDANFAKLDTLISERDLSFGNLHEFALEYAFQDSWTYPSDLTAEGSHSSAIGLLNHNRDSDAEEEHEGENDESPLLPNGSVTSFTDSVSTSCSMDIFSNADQDETMRYSDSGESRLGFVTSPSAEASIDQSQKQVLIDDTSTGSQCGIGTDRHKQLDVPFKRSKNSKENDHITCPSTSVSNQPFYSAEVMLSEMVRTVPSIAACESVPVRAIFPTISLTESFSFHVADASMTISFVPEIYSDLLHLENRPIMPAVKVVSPRLPPNETSAYFVRPLSQLRSPLATTRLTPDNYDATLPWGNDGDSSTSLHVPDHNETDDKLASPSRYLRQISFHEREATLPWGNPGASRLSEGSPPSKRKLLSRRFNQAASHLQNCSTPVSNILRNSSACVDALNSSTISCSVDSMEDLSIGLLCESSPQLSMTTKCSSAKIGKPNNTVNSVCLNNDAQFVPKTNTIRQETVSESDARKSVNAVNISHFPGIAANSNCPSSHGPTPEKNLVDLQVRDLLNRWVDSRVSHDTQNFEAFLEVFIDKGEVPLTDTYHDSGRHFASSSENFVTRRPLKKSRKRAPRKLPIHCG